MSICEPRIRPIKPTELDALIELYEHLHADDAPLPPEDRLRSLWAEIVVNPLLHYVVAEIDGRFVGSCTLAIVPNLTRGARPYGLIENVVTHTDYRRRGIGTAVLRHALGIAWAENCYKVMLLTGTKKEGTLRFYEKAGFRRGVKIGLIARPPEPPIR
jgi:ribosomal protein S18 acetylase RimI-like enzyme